jgi:hypothetical protein
MRRKWCPTEQAQKILDAVDRQQKMIMGFMERLNG